MLSRYLNILLLVVISINLSADTTFFVIGDWGSKGEKAQVEVAQAMDKIASERKVDFIATVGDNFYNDGVDSLDDEHFKRSFEDVYNLPHLKDLDWWVTLGNHDCRGDRDIQIQYHTKNPKWNLPAYWYKQTFDNLDLIVLDTNTLIPSYVFTPSFQSCILPGEKISEEKNWFINTMKEPSKNWRVVLGHHPLYSSGGYGLQEGMALRKNFLPILRENADLYMSGHEHHLEILKDKPEEGNLTYVVSGGGHEFRNILQEERQVYGVGSAGFVVVTLGEKTGKIELVNEKAKILHSYEIKKR